MGFLDSGAQYEVASGEHVVIMKPRAPVTIAIFPGDGAVASVDVSATPSAAIRSGAEQARWVNLETGITDSTMVVFPGPLTSLRLSSAGGTTQFEVVW